MFFEMRTFSCLPLDFPKLLKLKLEVGDVLRGSSYGKNYGAWISEFGRLNQIWELWAYDSLADYEYFNSKLLINKDVVLFKYHIKRYRHIANIRQCRGSRPF